MKQKASLLFNQKTKNMEEARLEEQGNTYLSRLYSLILAYAGKCEKGVDVCVNCSFDPANRRLIIRLSGSPDSDAHFTFSLPGGYYLPLGLKHERRRLFLKSLSAIFSKEKINTESYFDYKLIIDFDIIAKN